MEAETDSGSRPESETQARRNLTRQPFSTSGARHGNDHHQRKTPEDMENVHSQSMGGITQSLEAVLIVKVA
jgi:hypothetical protein